MSKHFISRYPQLLIERESASGFFQHVFPQRKMCVDFPDGLLLVL
jgi:hypothetical protein